MWSLNDSPNLLIKTSFLRGQLLRQRLFFHNVLLKIWTFAISQETSCFTVHNGELKKGEGHVDQSGIHVKIGRGLFCKQRFVRNDQRHCALCHVWDAVTSCTFLNSCFFMLEVMHIFMINNKVLPKLFSMDEKVLKTQFFTVTTSLDCNEDS